MTLLSGVNHSRSRLTTIPLLLPSLRVDQKAVISHPATIKYVAIGRRGGKTLKFGTLALAAANNGAAVGWGVPTYKNARPAWRFFLRAVAQLGKRVHINRADLIITFPSGGFLAIYSMDNVDAIRSEALDLFLGDEAPLYRPDDVSEVVIPTLADRGGKAALFGTPKGLNWFYLECMKADSKNRVVPEGLVPYGDTGLVTPAPEVLDPYTAFFTAPSSLNPLPNIQKAFRMARERLPSRIFRQEWLAEFVEEGGEVFRKIERCIIPVAPPDMDPELAKRMYPQVYPKFPMDPYPGTFVIAIDWGREDDFTVVGVGDANTRRLVDYDAFRIVDWELQQDRIVALGKKWGVMGGYGELNSMGSPNVSAIQRKGVRIEGFYTSSTTKALGIEELTLAIEDQDIGFPDIPELIAQLRAYTQERMPSGMIRYNAPSGLHDDYVIMLMLLRLAMIELPSRAVYGF